MLRDTSSTLEVGYAKRDMTPAIGSPLAGRPMLLPRLARSVHDRLFARAVHIKSGSDHVTILSVDLLLVTKGLQLDIARASGHAPETLLIMATHTHSGPGGYWRGSFIESFMGRYVSEMRTWLVKCCAETVQEATEALSSAELSTTSFNCPAMSTNRRESRGAVDPVLTVLKFVPVAAPPICIISFGAHPIVGLERSPYTITADYPGEVCRRLEKLGTRVMYIQGACGGTNPSWFTAPLETHIQRLGDEFEKSVLNVLNEMRLHVVAHIAVKEIPLRVAAPSFRIAPDGLPGMHLLDFCLLPLRHFLRRMAEQGLIDNRFLSLSVVCLGSVVLLGVPGEIGPRASLSLRSFFASAKVDQLIVASLCNGYIGYIHRKRDYKFGTGMRFLALYENAMSLAGRSAGESILSLLERNVHIFSAAP